MAQHIEQSWLPYTQEQLFDLVADVERYAEFVPLWIEARILRREGDTVYVEQTIGLGKLQQRFTSKGVLKRPASVQVTSEGGPFRRLDIQWNIGPPSARGCTLTLTMDFQLRSGALHKLVEPLLLHETGRLLKIFEQRAHRLYGGAAKG